MSTNTNKAAQTPLEVEVVEAIQASAACMEKAAAAYQAKEAQDRQVQAAIPGAVEACVKAGMIAPEERDDLALSLKDPVKAVELVKHAAEFKAAGSGGELPAREVGDGGRAVMQKAASAFVPVGGRREYSEADEAFDRVLLNG